MFPRSQLGNTAPDAPAQGFAGRLPGAGSAVPQSRSWYVKPGQTGWQGATGQQAGIYGDGGVYYDNETKAAILAGNTPASLMWGNTRVNYQDDPVLYAHAAGLTPRTEQDVAALKKWPELALHGVSQIPAVNGMIRNSTSQVVGTAIHASGGSTRPADCKCSFTFTPLEGVQASLSRNW